MKRVFEFIEQEKGKIYNHPDLVKERQVNNGLNSNFYKIPIHRKFDWIPAFIHLSMTFRDINRLYLRYENPKNEYERAINLHVDEDSEHYKLFFHDLKVLGYDESQPLSRSILTIWSDKSIEVRKYIYSVMKRCFVCGDDPFLKAAYMQANESTVSLFFEVSRLHAAYFEEKTGVKLRYFGMDHVESEKNTDHMLDLNLFCDIPVDDNTVEKGIDIAKSHFASFKEFLDFKEHITSDPEVQLERWPEPEVRQEFRTRSL